MRTILWVFLSLPCQAIEVHKGKKNQIYQAYEYGVKQLWKFY